MSKATKSLGPNELIGMLTLEAVNLLFLGGNADEPDVSKLESLIALVAEAWELPQEALDQSKKIIDAEREAVRHIVRGEKAKRLIPQNKLLQCVGSADIMQSVWGLFETTVRLDTREKREQILQNTKFLAEYLGMEEWIFRTKILHRNKVDITDPVAPSPQISLG